MKLFEDLRDSEINSREILKNQAMIKSDLIEIKIGGKKTTDQKNTIKDVTNFFD